jgi:RHS repeat-associated protein
MGVNYSTFGVQMDGRKFVVDDYRYHFNGKENDDDWTGNSGDSYDFGARIYSSKLGVFLSLDPLMNEEPELSPYIFAADDPISYIDQNGEGPVRPKIFHFKYDLGNDGSSRGNISLTSRNLNAFGSEMRAMLRWLARPTNRFQRYVRWFGSPNPRLIQDRTNRINNRIGITSEHHTRLRNLSPGDQVVYTVTHADGTVETHSVTPDDRGRVDIDVSVVTNQGNDPNIPRANTGHDVTQVNVTVTRGAGNNSRIRYRTWVSSRGIIPGVERRPISRIRAFFRPREKN